MDVNNLIISALEKAMSETKKGTPYWRARDLQAILGYVRWENFEKVIEKARMACESSGIDPDHQFLETTKMVTVGSGAQVAQRDLFLTKYACYLIAMNGEPSKPEIAAAQTYFAVQTHKQETFDKLTEEEKRLQLRRRVSDANIKLSSAAKKAGVVRYPIFQDAGYRGLYGMGLKLVKERKGLTPREDLLDRAGRTELAANEFRITQAEEKLVRDRVNTERDAINTHRQVGEEVRLAIRNLGGTMPEDLAPEPSIKKLLRKKTKSIPKAKLIENKNEKDED